MQNSIFCIDSNSHVLSVYMLMFTTCHSNLFIFNNNNYNNPAAVLTAKDLGDQ